MITLQQMFDTSARHLLTQKRKAEVRGTCRYRVGAGRHVLKCALGCLIPAERYRPSLEGKGGLNGEVMEAVTGSATYPSNLTSLAAWLQSVHDDNDPCDWPSKLVAAASEFGLSADIVAEMAPDQSEWIASLPEGAR